MGVKETVDAKINGKKVMVFAKSWCGYCNMAKKALAKYIGNELSAEDYEVWDIDNEAQENAIQDYLGKLTGARSVPRVFINGKCIGGGTETQDADKSGELRRMIAAV